MMFKAITTQSIDEIIWSTDSNNKIKYETAWSPIGTVVDVYAIISHPKNESIFVVTCSLIPHFIHIQGKFLKPA